MAVYEDLSVFLVIPDFSIFKSNVAHCGEVYVTVT